MSAVPPIAPELVRRASPEGGAAPVRTLSFSNTAILRPYRLQVITTISREAAEHSNVESIVRQTLAESTGLALDLQVFSSDPGDVLLKPPGLFAGTAPIAATPGVRQPASAAAASPCPALCQGKRA
jgi:hypothetical protein